MKTWAHLSLLLVFLLAACSSTPVPSASPSSVPTPIPSALAALTAMGMTIAGPPSWHVIYEQSQLEAAYTRLPAPYISFLRDQVKQPGFETFRAFAWDQDPNAAQAALPGNLIVADLSPSLVPDDFTVATESFSGAILNFYHLLSAVERTHLDGLPWPAVRYRYTVRGTSEAGTVDIFIEQYLIDGPRLMLFTFSTSNFSAPNYEDVWANMIRSLAQ